MDYKEFENYFASFDSPSFTEQQVIDLNAAVTFAYILRLLFLVLASNFKNPRCVNVLANKDPSRARSLSCLPGQSRDRRPRLRLVLMYSVPV